MGAMGLLAEAAAGGNTRASGDVPVALYSDVERYYVG